MKARSNLIICFRSLFVRLWWRRKRGKSGAGGHANRLPEPGILIRLKMPLNAVRAYTIFVECVMAAVIFSGCTSTMSLQYARPELSEQSNGRICVVVDDQRSSEEIGGDPARVGTIRNGFGMPFPLRSNPDRLPPLVIDELVSDCLGAAGYTVVENDSGLPQMYVALKSLWSDGYQYSRMWLTMSIELKKDEGSRPVWQHNFESGEGIVWTVGSGKFDEGFTDLLEDTKKQLITQFDNRNFQKSYASLKEK